MCGICGIYAAGGIGGREKEALAAMNAGLVHRGPDEEGYYYGDRTAFGHRRLSVIDLSSGRQPLANEDESIWITFNGEIYNYRELRAGLEARGHRFRTNTDTEVIVHLYEERGPEAVAELNGMFAFAIWDGRSETLMLARDRAGIKPLYYAEPGGRFIFASELTALLAGMDGPVQVDEGAICRYLLLQYVPGPGTVIKGVGKLSPGTILMLGRGVRREYRFWQAPKAGSDIECDGVLFERLESAVESQLVSDVPLGAFLSGGVDSSAVVALMKRAGHGFTKTFSIGFEGHHAHDERPYARRVAQYLGTEHHETALSPEDFIEYFQRAAAAMDEPLADPAAVPTLKLSELARGHVTVVLTGEGGDELFGGYKRYLYESVAGGRFNGPVSRMAVDAVRGIADRRKLKALRALTSPDWADAHLNWSAVFLKEELEGLTAGGCKGAWEDAASILRLKGGEGVRLDNMLRCDFGSWLPDDLLAKVDRMSMAVSLEARVPFLDNGVVEMALSTAVGMKVKGLTTKYMLKQTLSGMLPDDIINRRKKGFDLPLAAWFRGPLKGYVRELLTGGGCPAFLDAGYVARMVSEHESGVKDWALPLFSLMAYKEWSKRLEN